VRQVNRRADEEVGDLLADGQREVAEEVVDAPEVALEGAQPFGDRGLQSQVGDHQRQVARPARRLFHRARPQRAVRRFTRMVRA